MSDLYSAYTAIASANSSWNLWKNDEITDDELLDFLWLCGLAPLDEVEILLERVEPKVTAFMKRAIGIPEMREFLESYKGN